MDGCISLPFSDHVVSKKQKKKNKRKVRIKDVLDQKEGPSLKMIVSEWPCFPTQSPVSVLRRRAERIVSGVARQVRQGEGSGRKGWSR